MKSRFTYFSFGVVTFLLQESSTRLCRIRGLHAADNKFWSDLNNFQKEVDNCFLNSTNEKEMPLIFRPFFERCRIHGIILSKYKIQCCTNLEYTGLYIDSEIGCCKNTKVNIKHWLMWKPQKTYPGFVHTWDFAITSHIWDNTPLKSQK